MLNIGSSMLRVYMSFHLFVNTVNFPSQNRGRLVARTQKNRGKHAKSEKGGQNMQLEVKMRAVIRLTVFQMHLIPIQFSGTGTE